MQGSGGTLRQTDPPSPVSPNHQQPFAVEICCGQASLSRELINVGFSVLAVDHVMHDPQVPVTLLALTQASHQKILIDLLHNRPPDYIHLGMGSLLAYVQAQNNVDLTKFWHSLTEIFFHNCCKGHAGAWATIKSKHSSSRQSRTIMCWGDLHVVRIQNCMPPAPGAEAAADRI